MKNNIRKRVLYFHHAIGLGGAPRSLSFLIAGMDRDQYEPIVVMPKRKNNDTVRKMFRDAGADVLEEQDVRPFNGSTVAPCNTAKKRAYALLSYNRLVKCAKRVVGEQKPDLVHLNSTCLVGAAKGTHIANDGIPVVAHVREPLTGNLWGQNLARLNRKHVNHFIGIDQFGLDSIGSIQDRSTVIYNFVDRDRFAPDEKVREQMRELNQWRNNEVVFLSLSRVAPFNGASNLAKLILANEAKLNPNARFVFAGFRKPYSDYEESVIELIRKSDQMSWFDFVHNSPSLINASDVVVAPYLTPHSARSVFEGAAIGKPALISQMPNLKELIIEGETGFSFDIQSGESFCKKVNQLCDDTVRGPMASKSLRIAEQKFDQHSNTSKTVCVYEQLWRAKNKH